MAQEGGFLTTEPVRPLTDREISALLGALFGGLLSSGMATPEILGTALTFWQEKGLPQLVAILYHAEQYAKATDG